MARRKYTDDEKEFIISFAYGHGHKEIMEAFNRKFEEPISFNQVVSYLSNHKISTGRTGHFKKGYKPFNKGIHSLGPTQFKKGNMPPGYKQVGTEMVRNRLKTGRKYVYVKIAEPNKWRLKHVLEWEKYHGPVLKGEVVIFLDGDTLNTDINNLMLIDRKVLVVMNWRGLRYQDPESTRTGAYVAELVTKIAEARKR